MKDEDRGKGTGGDPQDLAEHDRERRRFLNTVTIGLGAVGTGVIGVPIVGFIGGPMLEETTGAWQPVGRVEDFPVGSTTLVEYQDPSPLAWAGVTARTAAWLRRSAEAEFIAFSVNCTHLGCPVRWLEGAGLFMCPCHGGVYYRDGRVAAGPPPKELRRYPVRVQDGQVQILTSPLPAAA